jgi:hypothetical protein
LRRFASSALLPIADGAALISRSSRSLNLRILVKTRSRDLLQQLNTFRARFQIARLKFLLIFFDERRKAVSALQTKSELNLITLTTKDRYKNKSGFFVWKIQRSVIFQTAYPRGRSVLGKIERSIIF